MSQLTTEENSSKFQRYRARQAAQGMRLLRVWVPNPQSLGFAEEARRQAALLCGMPEETDTLDFIESVADLDGWAA